MDAQQAEQRPILVYQMGKVGSRSVVRAIEDLTARPVYHIHQLDEKELQRLAEQNLKSGNEIKPHIKRGPEAKREIIDAGKPADIVTLVREPISRNISAFFQNIGKYCKDRHPDPVELVRLFLEKYPHGQPNTWFDREIKKFIGIDVFETPFDHAKGWQVYEKDQYRMLLIRCETPDDVKSEALSHFFGWPDVQIGRVNATGDKRQRKTYEAFKEKANFSEQYLDRMLRSRYAVHFYTHSERVRTRKRWTNAAQASTPDVSQELTT